MRRVIHLLTWSLLLAALPGCADTTPATGATATPPIALSASPTLARSVATTATRSPAAVETPTMALRSAPSACPVTLPNGSTPPGERPTPRHHGSGALWTVLQPNGTIELRAQDVGPDGSLGTKFPWWRGEQARGQLTIEGRRLDAPAPPLRAHVPGGYGETGFQATGIYFPSEGCWEVAGRAGAASLTFVTLVVKQ